MVKYVTSQELEKLLAGEKPVVCDFWAEDAAMKYGITSIPNVILFKNGKPAANSLGFVPEKALADFVEKNI